MSAAFDATGRGLVCGLVLKSGTTRALPRGVWVWRTGDGGRTFAPPVPVSGWGPGNDAPWLAIEPRRPGTAHVVWAQGPHNINNDNAIAYARSTDAGQTFTAPRIIAGSPSGAGNPRVACGRSGSLYVLYAVGGPAPQAPMTATVACSRDGGQTFGLPVALGHGTGTVVFPNQNRENYADSLPAIASDPHTGLVCAVFTVHQAGASHADVMLTATRDGGRTWSPPAAVTPHDQLIYFQPQVAIDNSGRIGVMAYTMSPGGLIGVVLMLAKPYSLRFGPPIALTMPFNPHKGQGPEWRVGNYQALAATRGAFHPLWTDTRTGTLELFTAVVSAST
jgi:hypothetical protein